jgi:YegS/Rv2252/BmrU family lipid kinase
VKALFVVSQRAGVKRRHEIRSMIDQTCDCEHEIALRDEEDDLDALIGRARREQFDVVYAVGGDGTVHEVAKRLIRTPLTLGIVPTGSGNGLARHIGLPMDVRASIRACNKGRIATIDTATVNATPFIGTMGIGFDAWVAEQFAGSTVRGLRTYFNVAVRGLFGYSPGEYEMELDGERFQTRALLIAIANASQYGSNARIAPLASMQDGVLDVVIVERLSLVTQPWRLFAGTLDRARGITMRRARQVKIQRPSAGPAHLDGEPVTLPESLTIEIVPQSLRVLVPDTARAI